MERESEVRLGVLSGVPGYRAFVIPVKPHKAIGNLLNCRCIQ